MNKVLALAATIILALLLSLVVGVMVVKVAFANPIESPLIQVNSPQNNKIYSSNDIQLDFTALPNTGYNFTSFAYSLDGQAAKATNGSTILTNLSYGSHTLIIYGTGTYKIGNNTFEHNDTVVAMVYFDALFSTSWVVFTIILIAVIAIGLLIFFNKRRQLITRLKGKKTVSFWFGLLCFLFSATLFFVPSVWQMADDYLFPHYPQGISVFPGYGIIFGLVFMGIGFYMMMLGTQESRNLRKRENGAVQQDIMAT
jgi:hypothetical protein